MRSYKKLLLVVFGLMILILVGVLGESVYAENTITPEEHTEKGCYYVTYNVGEKTAQTNSICFKDEKDSGGNDQVYMTTSDGASDPIELSDGRKLYMELVGRNSQYWVVDEEKGETVMKNADNDIVAPNIENGGASPTSETPAVQLMAKFDDGAWESVSTIDLNKFKDQDARWSSFQKIAEMLDNGQFALNYSNLQPAGVVIDDVAVEESEEGDRSEEEQTDNYGSDDGACYDNSGKLGWIICPIVSGISGVGQWLWGEIETNFLQIRVGEFFKADGGVQKAWEIFRDIANIIFIILFMFVIFSQLTGIGIDNYGIKKILPKLIVVAILINLSYVICMLAVDLSNILGVGLNGLFSGLATSVGESAQVAMEGYTAGQSLAALGLGAGAGGIFVLFTLLTGPFGFVTGLGALAAVGLAVLGIVITVVVSILFLFLILMIRNAGIVILIAIAPVAIVCYMLPNTEKLSKKWFDLLKALLIVYPICGAMIGAGKLAGIILASTGSEAMSVAGMIVEVLPFFLIPMLLKQSLALAGNIGARLSSVGRSLGKRGSSTAKGAIQNSNRFKDWSQFQQNQAGVRRAQRIQNRLQGRLARGGDLSQRQQDKLRKAQDVVLAQRKTERENEIRTQDGYADAMMYKQDIATDAEAAAIARLNDPVAQQAERQALAEENRLKQDKARTALMLNNTRGEGLDQLMTRWNTAFDSGNAEDLSAITNVINQRYGSSGASSIANSLNTKHNIANNQNFQTSMRTLQQTMNDNTSFAGNMKTKSPDAFQMIGDAGMRFDQTANGGAGAMVQEDMSYFTEHNQTATKVSDWANVSGATLQRAIDSGENAISSDMIERLLNSEDPSVVSGLQSEQGKREALEAALYNRQHNPTGMGPNPDNATASANYRAETANRQNDNDLMIAHEQDARGRGKTNVNIPASVINGTPATTIQGYAVPAGLRTNNGTWTRNADGDHIYTGQGGRQWNVSTGRYVRNNGGNGAP